MPSKTGVSDVSNGEPINLEKRMTATSDSDVELKEAPVPSYLAQYLLFWVLGLINNLGYVVVLASAKSLAESFDSAHLIGVLQWANIGMGLAAKLLNTIFFLEYSYMGRMIVTTVLLTCGLTITAISTQVRFEVAVMGILLIGGGSALGESVLLGFFKLFHPSLTGAWSSGTGGAGVFGTLSYILLFSVLELENLYVFLILVPTSFIYFAAFSTLYYKYAPIAKYNKSNLAEPLLSENDVDSSINSTVFAKSNPNLASKNQHQDYVPPFEGIGSLPLSISQLGGDAHNDDMYNSLLSDNNSVHTPTMPQVQPQTPLSFRSPLVPYGFGGNNTPVLSHLHGHTDSPTGGLPPLVINSSASINGSNTPTYMPSTPIMHHAGGLLGDSQRVFNVNGEPVVEDLPSFALANQEHSSSLLGSGGRWGADDDVGVGMLDDELMTSSNGSMTKSKSDKLSESTSNSDQRIDMAAEHSVVDVKSLPMSIRLKNMFSLVGTLSILLCLVYFFEYVACVGFASKSNPKHPGKTSWLYKNAYEVLSFCYQLGVLISRSSISLIQIDRVEILCFVQGCNFLLWLFQVLYKFMSLPVQFISMIWVGLYAGLMYVNVFYKLMKDERIQADKELAINIVSVFVNIGVMMSSFFTLIANATFL